MHIKSLSKYDIASSGNRNLITKQHISKIITPSVYGDPSNSGFVKRFSSDLESSALGTEFSVSLNTKLTHSSTNSTLSSIFNSFSYDNKSLFLTFASSRSSLSSLSPLSSLGMSSLSSLGIPQIIFFYVIFVCHPKKHLIF